MNIRGNDGTEIEGDRWLLHGGLRRIRIYFRFRLFLLLLGIQEQIIVLGPHLIQFLVESQHCSLVLGRFLEILLVLQLALFSHCSLLLQLLLVRLGDELLLLAIKSLALLNFLQILSSS